VVAGDEELGLGAGGQEAVGVVAAGGADGQAETDEAGDAWVSAGGAQADVRAEGEAGEDDRLLEDSVHVGYGGADVFDFAAAFVVDALAEAGAAEVEAQGGDGEVGEGLHRVVDDLVMHGAARGGVGVGYDGGVGDGVEAGVEDGFEAADGAEEVVERADVGLKGHKDRV
jgi:hypothetical protein